MIKTITAILLLSSLIFAQSNITLSISGMTCGGCAKGLNEVFKEDFPQYVVHVDYETAKMLIENKDDTDIDVVKVKKYLLRWDIKQNKKSLYIP